MRQARTLVGAMLLAAGIVWGCGVSETGEAGRDANAERSKVARQESLPATRPVAQVRTVRVQQISMQTPEANALLARFREFRDGASSGSTRMQVMLLVSTPGDELVRAEASVEAAQDDMGRSFAGGVKAMRPAGWDHATNVSLNRHEALLGLEFPEGPAADAREIHLKGSVHLRLGKSRKSAVRMIDLVPQTLVFDDLELRLRDIRGEWKSMSLTFRGTEEVDRLSNFVISDGKGAVLSGELRMDGFRGPPEMTYVLNAMVERVQIDATWFDTIEDVQVPFDLAVGVGL